MKLKLCIWVKCMVRIWTGCGWGARTLCTPVQAIQGGSNPQASLNPKILAAALRAVVFHSPPGKSSPGSL